MAAEDAPLINKQPCAGMADAAEHFDSLFKIVLVGDSNVGKSNLLARLVNNEFLADSRPTIGIEFGTKTVAVDGATVRAQVWDTAGQERYRAITTAYYRGAHGGVIVYDVTHRASFESAWRVWLRELRKMAGPSLPVVLIGNKADLRSQQAVPAAEARERALAEGVGFFETSALTGENVATAFEEFIAAVYRASGAHGRAKRAVRREDLVGKRRAEKTSKKSACC